MLRVIFALIFIVNIPSIAMEESSPNGERTFHNLENQGFNSVEMSSPLNDDQPSMSTLISGISRNFLKKCISHVSKYPQVYSTFWNLAMFSSLQYASAFSPSDCPRFVPGPTPDTQEWFCPEHVWLCTNGTETKPVPYAFIGCPEEVGIDFLITEPVWLEDYCSATDKLCLADYTQYEKRLKEYDNSMEFLNQHYAALRENLPISFEGKCAFSRQLTMSSISACMYDFIGYMGKNLGNTAAVVFYKEK